MKVMTVLGTRPEIIRLARVMAVLDKTVDHVIVHTGQNYDYELNDVFFEELEVRKPDYFLGVDTSSLGKTLGEILIKTEEVLMKEKPDAMIVLGDTNSATATIMAKRMKVPTYHMEAGNRSFDANVPEEINRKLVDHVADFNLVYTEHARRHLISEGLSHRFIYLTGSPMREVLDHFSEEIDTSSILSDLGVKEKQYFIVSVHREENVDDPNSLKRVVDCLIAIRDRYGFPVVVSTHPRTRKRLDSLGLIDGLEGIQFLKPFGFFAYNNLQKNAYCAISDSGTISEESAILDFPAVTLRQSIERPEALDAGSIGLTGLDPEVLLAAITAAVNRNEIWGGLPREVPEEYLVRNTSERVLRLVLGTAKLTPKWRNMEKFSRYEW